MQSIHNQIEENIKNKKKGTIIFASDYPQFDTNNIRKILARLCRQQLIVRISPGIYLYPEINKITGNIIYPSTEEIAKSISKNEKIRITYTGTYAQYLLGLSTQIPTKIVLLTDGSARMVKLGERTIKFQKITAKKLAFKNKRMALITFALRDIGPNNITLQQIQIIRKHLSKLSTQTILNDSKLAPEWIRKIYNEILNDR